LRRNADLAICCAVGVAATAAVHSGVPGHVIAGLVLFVLPGYASIRALAAVAPLELPERAVVVVTLSIAAVLLGGLALNFTPWGLERTSWALYLLAFTVIASAVAAVRGSTEPTRRPSHRVWRRPWSLRPLGLLLAALAITVTAASLAIAQTTVPNHTVRGYTLLSATPVANQSRVVAQVVNEELSPAVYRLEARADGRVVRIWRRITLDPSASWHVAISRLRSPFRGRLAFHLYRSGEKNVYRRVFLEPYCRDGRLIGSTCGARSETVPPSKPSALRVATDCKSETLTWSRPHDNVRVTNYVVWRRSRTSYRWQLVGRPVTGELVISRPPVGLFDWRVRARDVSGNLSPMAYLLGTRVEC
jgi:hypothetical protein